MDKQFARILMLSVLLPAGAALAGAMQREPISFAAMDQTLASKLTAIPSPATARRIGLDQGRATFAESAKK